MTITGYTQEEHDRHATDGRFHDDCLLCIERRRTYTPLPASESPRKDGGR